MKTKQTKILFVCLGNICRSPMAHGVMQYLVDKYECQNVFCKIDSCGMYGEAEGTQTHQRTILEIQNQLNYQFMKPSRNWSAKDYDEYDLILAMDKSNYFAILKQLGKQKISDAAQKVKLFRDFDPKGKGNVMNPYGGEQIKYTQVFQIIERTCKNIIQSHVQIQDK
ncbi:Low_molecular weight protein-tyrosine-phosphatase [Hexamita inflata]|uniref:Low molecular weight protein-tyrosine-phosphatase n=1 Tax=Hexamita inflata TaxID=28002 RepID=A0AA86QAX6_9EUKA|nr:Low molecular weight protein-tyrosine-phosphatase [Hexamita inflata]